ncbi:MAG: hypothetical protein PHX05_00035 [Acidobacteriota bacterium]|nr:hypothetical protein [Acidobacteriota bacterium]
MKPMLLICLCCGLVVVAFAADPRLPPGFKSAELPPGFELESMPTNATSNFWESDAVPEMAPPAPASPSPALAPLIPGLNQQPQYAYVTELEEGSEPDVAIKIRVAIRDELLRHGFHLFPTSQDAAKSIFPFMMVWPTVLKSNHAVAIQIRFAYFSRVAGGAEYKELDPMFLLATYGSDDQIVSSIRARFSDRIFRLK